MDDNEKGDQEVKKTAKSTDTLKLNITTYTHLKNQIQKFIQINWQNNTG